MKKIKLITFLMASAFLMFNVNNASAFSILNDWQLDLNAQGGGLTSPISTVLFQSPGVGSTMIYQNLGGNGQIDNGDTFNERSWMSADQYLDGINFGNLNLNLGAGNHLLVVINATGAVVNLVSQDKYGYTLAGTVDLYLDDDQTWTPFVGGAEFGAAPTLLASSVIMPSAQAGTADGFLGGTDPVSNWNVTVKFTSMLPGVFLDKDGNDLFTTYPVVIADAQGVTRIKPSLTAYNPQTDELIFTGGTGDDFQLGVVPEPTTMLLLGVGLIGLAGISRKKS